MAKDKGKKKSKKAKEKQKRQEALLEKPNVSGEQVAEGPRPPMSRKSLTRRWKSSRSSWSRCRNGSKPLGQGLCSFRRAGYSR